MASTFSELKFELIGTGDQAGNWGETTNSNIGTAIEQAITGLGNPVFASDANLTIGLTDTVELQTARALVLNVTSTGSLTQTRELIIPTIQKQYVVQNNTTGGQGIIVKTAGGTGIVVPNGRKMHLYVDGVNVVDMVSTMSSLTLGSALPITSGGTGQATRQEAMDALAGAVTSGQYLRGDGTDVVMSAIQAADVPTLNQNTTGTAANVTGVVAVANGGTGTSTPSLVAGTNVTITGTWPNQTIAAAGGSGGGDVTGPSSSTDNGIALFNGTTGKIIKDAAAQDGFIHGTRVGRGAGAVSTNSAVGASALNANTTGSSNTAVGALALRLNTTGSNSTALGTNSLISATTSFSNTAIGSHTMFSATGSQNTAVGSYALHNSTSGELNTAVGSNALLNNTTGRFNVAVGSNAGQGITTGTTNTFVGYLSGNLVTTGSKNTILGAYDGNQGGVDIRTSSNNIVLSDGDGNPRMRVNSSGNTTFSGTLAATSYSGSGSGLTGVPLATGVTGLLPVANGGTGTATPGLVAGTNITITGSFPNQTIAASGGGSGGDVTGPASSTANGVALFDGTTGKIIKDAAASDGLIYGLTLGRGLNAVSTNTVLGSDALSSNSSGAGNNTGVGYEVLRFNSSGTGNTGVGANAARRNTGSDNTAVGAQALTNNTSGNSNTAVGAQALATVNGGSDNSAFGRSALFNATTGSSNSAFGRGALANITTATQNTAVGANALNASTASNNTAVGQLALFVASTGTFNVAVGSGAGREVSTGATNTLIGPEAGDLITTGSNNTVLGGFSGNQGGVDIRTSSNNIVLSDGDGNPRIRVDSSGNTTLSGTLTATSYSGSGSGLTGVPLATGVTGLLPVANGGTGTATPGLVAGTNVTISGTWPNQTIDSTGGGGGGITSARAYGLVTIFGV